MVVLVVSGKTASPIPSKLIKHQFLNNAGEIPTFVLDTIGDGMFELEMRCYDQSGPELQRSTYSLVVGLLFVMALREACDGVLNQYARHPV